jgi:hypothetical protein
MLPALPTSQEIESMRKSDLFQKIQTKSTTQTEFDLFIKAKELIKTNQIKEALSLLMLIKNH